MRTRQPGSPRQQRRIEWQHAKSMTDTTQRAALYFEQRQGMLRNILTRQVPRLAAEHAHQLLQMVLASANLKHNDIRGWIMHAGGRDVLRALQKQFEVAPGDFHYSAAVLRDYGNLSSAFVYFVLQAAIDDDAEGGWWWMSAFGAGFSCHGALLEVQ